MRAGVAVLAAGLGLLAAAVALAGGAAPAKTLELGTARAYVPRPAPGAQDDYHCFLLDPKLRRNVFVTGADVRPGQPSIVHHVILFEAAGPVAAAAARADRRSGGRGWTCFGGIGLDEETNAAALRSGGEGPRWVAAWVPGKTTNDLPPGLGVPLARGSKLVMQVHYNLGHGARPDRSTVVLRTVPAAGSRLQPLSTVLLAAPVELPCPDGANGGLCDRRTALAELGRKYGPTSRLLPTGLLFFCGKRLAEATGPTTSCDRVMQRAVTVHGVGGHMHVRGRDVKIEVNPGTPRARTLLHIPQWNFHWQDVYYLVQPIKVRPGDVLRITCRYGPSTSTPARYVLWGEGTEDEMCLGVLQVTRG